MAASCSDDSGSGGGPFSVMWDEEKTIHPDREGAAVLLISAPEGTQWSAEIVEGDTWLSFDRTAAGNTLSITGAVAGSLSSRSLYLYYWPNRTHEERQGMVRFTFEGRAAIDLTVTQFTISPDGDIYTKGLDRVWPEIPARSPNSDFVYVTHFAPLAGSGGAEYEARNYTLCYDVSKVGAWWVAYPLHSSYIGSGRVESWAYDPRLATDVQADLSRSYPSPLYDRGHQIPNADRNANPRMQAQTFYFSNMTPQTAQLNRQPWAALEKMARDNWICSDTLYVVTGAWWSASASATPDRNGKMCAVPTAYFKAFARTVRGNVRRKGDRLGDYGAAQLKSIAFWVVNATDQGTMRDWSCSVADLEQLTGFNLFPTLDSSVKEQHDPLSWGL